MGTPNFKYVRPRSLKEAIEQLSSDDARIHAGGTDLLGCLRDGVFETSKIVSISQLKELRGIDQSRDGGLRIGALSTIAEMAASKVIRAGYPGLARAASEVASPQLRNQGTLGGNLCQKPRCWYYRGEFHCLRKGGDRCFVPEGENQFHCIFAGDPCYIVHPSDVAPMLVALGAVVRVSGPHGPRTLPLEKFFVLPDDDVERETVLEPGEILTEVLLPSPGEGLKTSYRKIRARQSWDFALAGMATAVRFKGKMAEDVRVVFSGAAPVPWRSREVEEAIAGKAIDAEDAARAAGAALKDAEPLSQNGYKVTLFRGMIEEELKAIARM